MMRRTRGRRGGSGCKTTAATIENFGPSSEGDGRREGGDSRAASTAATRRRPRRRVRRHWLRHPKWR